MNEIAAISPIKVAGAEMQVTVANIGNDAGAQQVANAADPAGSDFGSMLSEAISNLDGKVAKADDMVARFVVDDTTPIHHVTVALEEARMAVELATQVRQRLTEGYRQLMNMQL